MDYDTLASLSLATAAASVTVSRAGIFAPVREWAKARSRLLGDLLSCTWCISHWIAAAFVLGLSGRVPLRPYHEALSDSLVTWLAIIALAGLVHQAIGALDRAWPAKPVPKPTTKQAPAKKRKEAKPD